MSKIHYNKPEISSMLIKAERKKTYDIDYINAVGPTTSLTLRTVTAHSDLNSIYVAMNGSDTTGDGTSGNPFQTIQHALNNLGGMSIVTVIRNSYVGLLIFTAIVLTASITLQCELGEYAEIKFGDTYTWDNDTVFNVYEDFPNSFLSFKNKLYEGHLISETSYGMRRYDGASWEENTDIGTNVYSLCSFTDTALDNYIYAGVYATNNVIKRSLTGDIGDWTDISITGASACFSILYKDGYLYFFCSNGIYKSDIDGLNPTLVKSASFSNFVTSIVYNNVIYFWHNTNNTIYKSTDNLLNYSEMTNHVNGNFQLTEDGLYIPSANNYVYSSGLVKLIGDSFKKIETGYELDNIPVESIIEYHDRVYIFTTSGRIFRTTDYLFYEEVRDTVDNYGEGRLSIVHDNKLFYLLFLPDPYSPGQYSEIYYFSDILIDANSYELELNGFIVNGNEKNSGIGIANAYSLDIKWCEFKECWDKLVEDYGDTNSNIINSIFHNSKNAIDISKKTVNITIYYNLFYNITNNAINCSSIEDTIIYNNTFYNCQKAVENALYADLYNNIFRNNIFDIFCYSETNKPTLYNSVYQKVVNCNIDSTCQKAIPYFFDEIDYDFHIQTLEEGYIQNSKGKNIGTDTYDAGCYKVDRALLTDEWIHNIIIYPYQYERSFDRINPNIFVPQKYPLVSFTDIGEKLILKFPDNVKYDINDYDLFRILLEQTDVIRGYVRRDNKDCSIKNILHDDYKIKIADVDFDNLTLTFNNCDLFDKNRFERWCISIYRSGNWLDYKITESYKDGVNYVCILEDIESYGETGSDTDLDVKIEFREYKVTSDSINIAQYRYKGHNVNEMIGGAELELMVS